MSEQVFKENDEIDIFELLGRIWQGKKIIAAVTALFLALGVAYALIATPWYSAKARISAPFYTIMTENGIKKELLAQADMLINKIQSKYIDALKGQPKQDAFVNKVAPAKVSGTKNNLDDFFDIEVMGKSNDEAVAFIKKIVAQEQEIYKENVNLQRKNIETSIETTQKNIQNLKNQAEQFEKVLLPSKDKEIANLKSVVVPQKRADYDNLVQNIIPNLEKEIETIENELKSGNITGNSLSALRERLADLRDLYTTTTTTTKRQVEIDLHDAEFVKVAIAQSEKEELNTKLGELKSQINEQEGKLAVLNGSLNPLNLANVEIKDDFIITNEKPEKPKKLLIVAIAGFLGLVLGVFAVLVRGEIKKMKQKNLE